MQGDIQKGKDLKLISPTIALTLSSATKLGQLSSPLKQTKATKLVLSEMLSAVNKAKGKLILEPAASTLIEDITILLKGV